MKLSPLLPLAVFETLMA